MTRTTIAFDCDGTLIDDDMNAQEHVRTILAILSVFFDCEIIVWSGGGELYARQVANKIGITQYVDRFMAKDPNFVPDIAIDDMEECDLGNVTLALKHKERANVQA
jgi:phosphoserine phosphatase